MDSSDIEVPNRWVSGSLWGMTGYAQVITFIGAGGKTTCLRLITQEIHSAGHSVIATTTTKVFPEKSMKAWKNSNPPPYEHKGACFWYVAVMKENVKWIGPSLEAVDNAIKDERTVPDEEAIYELPLTARAGEYASPRTVPNLHNSHWVIEGDGAKRLNLKCWEPHEPQIPRQSDCVVLVLDGGLWGRVLQAEQVHRPARCKELLGQVWNAENAWRYFLKSPVFAPQYQHMSWVILLNRHGETAENGNGDLLEPWEPLHDLKHRWMEIQQEVKDLDNQPNHLRIAAGDVKEGKLQWFDLW